GHLPPRPCPCCRSLHDALPIYVDKNYLGSLAAGSLCSANAHYANMLLAFYLATGQVAANIVEGSQGITTTEIVATPEGQTGLYLDRKSTRLNSSHVKISYAVFC